jgi:hypothetical protein
MKQTQILAGSRVPSCRYSILNKLPSLFSEPFVLTLIAAGGLRAGDSRPAGLLRASGYAAQRAAINLRFIGPYQMA